MERVRAHVIEREHPHVDREKMEAEGRVRLSLFGPKGELRGALLADGTVVRLGPKEAEHVAKLVKANDLDGLFRVLDAGRKRRPRDPFVAAARFLDRVFDGAASQLVMSLLRSERISPKELAHMQAMIAQARRKKPRR